ALQGGPDITNPKSLVSMAVSSIGLWRNALKVSLLSAADVKAVPGASKMFPAVGKIINGLDGNFRWQHLPVPFEVYSDGISLPVFEEFGSGAAALHLSDHIDEQRHLMQDEEYRRTFRKDYDNKYGPRAWHRDFFDADIVECPDETVIGKTFGEVGVDRGGLHPVDAFLDLVVEHGDKLRWRTTISNHRPEVADVLAADPSVQLGFSDAGAHLRNMAFYNFGLRLLRRVNDAATSDKPFMTVEHAVHRLTGELADWYGLDTGHLRVGDRADAVVIDPAHLDETLDAYAESPLAIFGNLSRMVNRNDDTVTAVFVNGRYVFGEGEADPVLGTERVGAFLRAE
ncbi:amidohydrolase family protein, partial [Nocardia sp. NPDC060220]|uniref:amidohydrolase family protein n=1 Tax=Nocardia sp. NPDC060220 TaxID=3347076 RepID=UPI00365AB978